MSNTYCIVPKECEHKDLKYIESSDYILCLRCGKLFEDAKMGDGWKITTIGEISGSTYREEFSANSYRIRLELE